MSKEISKSQIDRLGDRLKKGNIDEASLRLLDQYRRSYAEAYEIVVGAIRNDLLLEPTGRPAKSTPSIAEKLRRESIRLTQIQDIAGCRLIAKDIADQNQVIESLSSLFDHVSIVDRRQQPSHGYRAVHVIVRCRGKLIEIQIRTELQHLWAELSEKSSDVLDQTIKYGGGDDETRMLLADISSVVKEHESQEMSYSLLLKEYVAQETALAQLQAKLSGMPKKPELIQRVATLIQKKIEFETLLSNFTEIFASTRGHIFDLLRNGIGIVEKLKD